jgi:DNA polymerase-3 subunit chi
MAAEWWFYHIEQGELVSAVAPLLEKCLERRWRVVVAGHPVTLEKLDAALWNWRDESFLPHGLAGSKAAGPASAQPVLLSPEAAPLNGASIAMLLDGEDADSSRFSRCLVVFDGADEPVRARAREQYRRAVGEGLSARYFQQDTGGSWVEKAQSRPSA